MTIYIRAGREIYRKRQKMLNFSSTGTGTVVGNEPFSPVGEFSPAFNFKTTEVTQTTEIIQAPAPVAKVGAIAPAPKPSYSVTISADAQAANQLNMRVSESLEDLNSSDASTGTATLTPAPSNPPPAPPTTTTTPHPPTITPPKPGNRTSSKRPRLSTTGAVSIAPTVTATITSNHMTTTTTTNQNNRRRNYYESHNATWSYTKCAILFFAVLLITWIPSSGNRVYSMIHTDHISKPLFFASAFVLPLQGFWNAIIYIVTSWAACKSMWGYVLGGLAGWWEWVVLRVPAGWPGAGGRRVSIVEITDVRRRGSGRVREYEYEGGYHHQGYQGHHHGGRSERGGGAWAAVMGGRKERKSESTSMEDLTGEGRGVDRVSPV